MSQRSLLVVGAGALGEAFLRNLPIPGFDRVVVVDADSRRMDVTSQAQTVAAARGEELQVEFRPVDLLEAGALENELVQGRFDVVVNLSTRLSVARWWTAARHPEVGSLFRRAGLGIWIPLQILLPLRIVGAAKAAGVDITLVNASYPDAVNAVLWRSGHKAITGTGNVALLEAALRVEIARRTGVPAGNIKVWLSAHYAHVRWAMGGGEADPPPPLLHAEVDGRAYETDLSLLRAAGRHIPWGAASNELTAAIIATQLKQLVADELVLAHMPGPSGHLGGYPVLVGRGTVSMELVPGFAFDDMVRSQENAQRSDGVDRITADGSVELTEQAAAALAEITGEHIRTYSVENIEADCRVLEGALERLATAT